MAFAWRLPQSSSIFATYASISAYIMLIQTMLNQFLPHRLRQYISNLIRHCLFFNKPKPNNAATLVVEERGGMCDNEIYGAAETYLATKIGLSIDLLKISKRCSEPNLTIKLARTETIRDTFQGIELEWRFVQEKDHKKTTSSKRFIGKKDDGADVIVRSSNNKEKRYFELSFDKNHRNRVLVRYVPFVLETAKTIEAKNRVIKLHTLAVRGSFVSSIAWDSINLDHPSTFDTLAMDPELKQSIKDDLDRFARQREFYRWVGRAWKRGYLLYGPPGTGKSSLIAAMANYLKLDVYDLELSNVKRDSALRKLLLRTANRSILVIEDIDCSIALPGRKEKVTGRVDGKRTTNCLVSLSPGDQQFTLSGLLNFIDGLWSSCVEERIIVFTTNHKDKLDPALLRPGRMDKHIHMSYLTPKAFRILASNYLNIRTRHHPLFAEIEELLDQVSVTPAQVAEELMKKKKTDDDDDDCDEGLKGLVDFLKCKKMKMMDSERKSSNNLKNG